MEREIVQYLKIKSNPKTIFDTLLSPIAIVSWWNVKTAIVVKEEKGLYALSWGEDTNDPDYVTHAIINGLESNVGFTLDYQSYYAKNGKLPFDVSKMKAQFSIREDQGNMSILEVKQTGIPNDSIADKYYESCIQGWNVVLENIKGYCEKQV